MSPLDKDEIEKIKEIARRIRIDVTKMVYIAGSGHIGGAFSCADILAVLFSKFLRRQNTNPFTDDRDRFVMSKGHGSAAVYAVMSIFNYFPEDILWTFRRVGSPLQGHPSRREMPFIEASTGSLGHGFSIAAGMAQGLKIREIPARVFTILGDGEVQEGQVWECFMACSHYKIDNICAVIDRNELQIDGATEDIMSLEPLDKKLESFRWNVITTDGHDIPQIISAFERFESNLESGKPTAIIAKTIKGKGVSVFEGNLKFHGVAPTLDELKKALSELGAPEEIENTIRLKKEFDG